MAGVSGIHGLRQAGLDFVGEQFIFQPSVVIAEIPSEVLEATTGADLQSRSGLGVELDEPDLTIRGLHQLAEGGRFEAPAGVGVELNLFYWLVENPELGAKSPPVLGIAVVGACREIVRVGPLDIGDLRAGEHRPLLGDPELLQRVGVEVQGELFIAGELRSAFAEIVHIPRVTHIPPGWVEP